MREEKTLRSVASPISSESQLDRPSGTTWNSQRALSHTVRASRCSPTARVCVGLLVNSFVICAVSSSRDSIRNETVYVCIVRLYGSAVALLSAVSVADFFTSRAYSKRLKDRQTAIEAKESRLEKTVEALADKHYSYARIILVYAITTYLLSCYLFMLDYY